jgi:hypothetical protein
MTLFAHHLELQHIPVLTVFLGIGAWLGWQAVSAALNRRDDSRALHGGPGGSPKD